MGDTTADHEGKFAFTNIILERGPHTLTCRAIDTASNFGDYSAPINLAMEADLVAPVTTPVLTGTPGDQGVFLSDVTVTLDAQDEPTGSGVARTEYSINGGDWMLYTGPLTITAEGQTRIGYRSVDNAGNAELDHATYLVIHKVSPTVSATQVGGQFGAFFDGVQRSTINRIVVEFSEPVWVTADDALVLYNRNTHAEVAITGATVTGNGTATLTWDLSGVALPDGYYTATLTAAEVTGAYGNTLDGDGDGQGVAGDDYSFQFHQLAGDVTGDAKVNLADLAVWMVNYDPQGLRTHTPSTGDFNGDGRADRPDVDSWRLYYNPVGLKTPRQSRAPAQYVADREAPPAATEVVIASFLAQADTPQGAASNAGDSGQAADTMPAPTETPAAPAASDTSKTSSSESRRAEMQNNYPVAARVGAAEATRGDQTARATPGPRPAGLDAPAVGFATASPLTLVSAEAHWIQPLVVTAPTLLGAATLPVWAGAGAGAEARTGIGPEVAGGLGRPPVASSRPEAIVPPVALPVRPEAPVEGNLVAEGVHTGLVSPTGSVAMFGPPENVLLGMVAIGAVASGAPRSEKTTAMRRRHRRGGRRSRCVQWERDAIS